MRARMWQVYAAAICGAYREAGEPIWKSPKHNIPITTADQAFLQSIVEYAPSFAVSCPPHGMTDVSCYCRVCICGVYAHVLTERSNVADALIEEPAGHTFLPVGAPPCFQFTFDLILDSVDLGAAEQSDRSALPPRFGNLAPRPLSLIHI